MRNMNKNLKLIIFIFLLFLIYISFMFYKVFKYEKIQDEKIKVLTEQVLKLRTLDDPYKKKTIEYSPDSFNYFALGNSITIHESVSYWPFDDRGMAATICDNDYVHLVNNYLKNKYGDSKCYSYNFFTWETMHHDRAELLSLIDPFLSENLNLVTIQLGENVSNLDTFKQDLIDLVNYIKSKAHNCKIIIIDDFWEDEVKSKIKKDVVQLFGLDYVDLTSIKDNKEYQCGIGTIIYDVIGGGEFKVTHSGVATHPGDKGFKFIADEIIESLK